MNNIKDEFIKAIMTSLKIDKNPFIFSTIDEFISPIKPTEYKEFMGELFGTQHSFLNGMDRIAKVAEQFKPQQKDDSVTIKAKELILWCETVNSTVYDNSKKSGRTFENEMKGTKFPNLSSFDSTVLNSVNPFCNLSNLVVGIRTYQTSADALSAFKQALSVNENESLQITGDVMKRLRIKR